MKINWFCMCVWLGLLLCGLGPRSVKAAQMTANIDWQGTHRYHLRTWMVLPQSIELRVSGVGFRNVSAIELDVLTTCNGKANRRTWNLTCGIDDVGITGVPFQGRQSDMDALMQYADQRLREGTVELVLDRSGRLKRFQLTTARALNGRARADNWEVLGLVVERAFAGFDLQRPMAWSDGSSWSETNPRFFGYPDAEGVISKGQMNHQASLVDEGTIRVASQGDCRLRTVGSGMVLDLKGSGDATLDAQSGVLLTRTWRLAGHSSGLNAHSTTQLVDAEFHGQMVHLGSGDDTPPLPVSGVRQPRGPAALVPPTGLIGAKGVQVHPSPPTAEEEEEED